MPRFPRWRGECAVFMIHHLLINLIRPSLSSLTPTTRPCLEVLIPQRSSRVSPIPNSDQSWPQYIPQTAILASISLFPVSCLLCLLYCLYAVYLHIFCIRNVSIQQLTGIQFGINTTQNIFFVPYLSMITKFPSKQLFQPRTSSHPAGAAHTFKLELDGTGNNRQQHNCCNNSNLNPSILMSTATTDPTIHHQVN